MTRNNPGPPKLPPPPSRDRGYTLLAVALTLATLRPTAAPAADSQSSAKAPLSIARPNRRTAVDFDRELLPVLRENCLACHSRTVTKGGLVLETPADLLRGGESGPSVIARKPATSPLLQLATHQDPDRIMPPPGNKARAVDLTPAQLGLIQLWIEQGAKPSSPATLTLDWQPLPAHLKGIYAVALTPDGRWAACARANRIFVYDTALNQPVGELIDPVGTGKPGPPTAHRDLIQALAFSPDGHTLASGGYREIKLWQLTRPPIDSPRPRPAPAEPQTMAQAPDQKGAAELTADGLVQLRLPQPDGDSKPLSPQPEHTLHLAQLEAAAAFLRGDLDHYETQIRTQETNLNNQIERGRKASDAVVAAEKALTEQAEKLAKTEPAGGEAEAQRVASTTRVKELEERLQSTTAPDAKTALETDLKRVRDELKAAEEKANTAKKELEETRRELDKRRLRKEVASTELDLATRSAATGTNLLAVARSELDAAQLQHQAAGQRFAEAKTAPLTRSSPATTLAFSPHARLATGHSNGWVRLWHPDTGEWIDTLRLHKRPIRGITWTNPSTLMAVDDRGRWKRARLHPEIRLLRRLGTGDGRSPIEDRVTALAFSPDGTRLASGGGEPSRSGEIKLWSVPAGHLLANWTNAHSDTVLSLAFDREGTRLASGGADRFARILDLQTGKALRNLEGHTHHVLSVAWHRNNRVLATAGADRVVKTWDVRSGERRKNFTGADKEVVGATFVGFTDRLIRASAEGKIVLLDDNGKELRPFEGPTDYLQSIALSADGRWLAAGGLDGVLWCWDIESGKPRAQFEAPAPAAR